jgi:peptidoglycan/LPS O-acetylase OafA/YrhL
VPERDVEHAHPRIRHVPGLDGLRGAAVLVVVAFHLGHLRGGYLGVDLFFVLSGYLITSLLLAEGRERGRIHLARFWERRARRLLPALGVLLVGIAAYARFVAKPEELHRIRWDGLATLFYVANWRAIFGKADYWALFTAPSPLEHAWSLAIEEQFYLVWPLVFVALLTIVRRSRRAARLEAHAEVGEAADERRSLAGLALKLSLVLGALSVAAASFFEHRDGWNRVYYGTDTRSFAILAGAAVASHTARFGPVRDGRPRRLLEVGGVLSAGVLGVAWVLLDGASSLAHHGGLTACSVAGAVVIASVAHPTAGVLARVFSFKPLRWMGLISYGAYLYHWPLIVWLSEDRAHLRGWPLAGLQFAVTIAVSIVSYKVIEQPIRHRTGWRRRTNVVVPGVGFATVALLVIVATIGGAAGHGSISSRVEGAARQAARRKGPTILVIGNSVADYLARDGMSTLGHEPALTVLNLAYDGCHEPPTQKFRRLDGTVSTKFGYSCDRGWSEANEKFHADFVIFARNGMSEADLWRGDHWVAPCSTELHDWSYDRFVAEAMQFARRGSQVVLVTSVPSDPIYAMKKQPPAYYRAVACGNQVMRDVAAAHPKSVRLVDLYAHYCDAANRCKDRLPDGKPLRPDGTHYRGEGAQVTSQWILARLGIDTRVSG